MNIVIFTHPAFLGSQSHARMAAMMARAYEARGHRVEVRQPVSRLHHRFRHPGLRKWAGYLDQYLLFGVALRLQARRAPPDTVYAFCDQALGPWIPAVADRPHVVHCNDLLALRSALGLIPGQAISWTGRLYQGYIRWGFRHARHFVSISSRTRRDLHEHGGAEALTSVVVPLGLNHPYRPLALAQADERLQRHGLQCPATGLLLHVGGGQWYKNTAGVVRLYAALVARRLADRRDVPALWLVGPPADAQVRALLAELPGAAEVRVLQGVDNDQLEALYARADALLFPSLAEGFGWPIAEALACGCAVITTDDEPMTEVGGPHAHYLPLMPTDEAGAVAWARDGSAVIEQVLALPHDERAGWSARASAWALDRYDPARATDRYLEIYADVLARSGRALPRSVTA